jgi:4-amino-4-deoxy-L-arabinose transferase-like glycosyltransferase
MTARRALWGLIALSTILRLAWAASLGVGNDEAYYYLFTLHPDWSYFDHPPMTAVIEAAGLLLTGGEPSPLSLRLGFVAMFAGTTWLMARLTSRFYGERAGVIAALLLNVTAYFGAAAGAFALPDGPLTFFWLLALDRLAAALMSPGRLRPWAWVGLAWGGALLSKYHGLLLPVCAGAYLVLEPRARGWLRRPGPYLALSVGLLTFAPVIGWNAAHDWASFSFQANRALGGLRFRPDFLAVAVIGQVGYALPWIWLPLMLVLLRSGPLSLWERVRVRVARTRGDGETSHNPPDPGLNQKSKADVRSTLTPALSQGERGKGQKPGAGDRFFLVQALVPLGAFLLVACQQPVMPHWGLVGLLPAFPMLGTDWAARWESGPKAMGRRLAWMAAVPVVLGILAVAHLRAGVFQKGGEGSLGLVKVAHDPTLDLYGWEQIARELTQRGLVGEPGTFLFTSKWYHSGQLAFATGARSPVLCYSARKPLGFAQWSRPEEWVGRDGILVVVNHSSTEPAAFDRWFERIEFLGHFTVDRAGAEVKRVRLYRCVRQTRPFPYAGLDPEAPRLAAGPTSPGRGRGR